MTTCRSIVVWLYLSGAVFAGITHSGPTGQSLYVRVQTAPTTYVAAALPEGMSGGLSTYSIDDTELASAGVSSAGAFNYTVRVGSPSTTANDTVVGYGVLPWNGSGELPPPANVTHALGTTWAGAAGYAALDFGHSIGTSSTVSLPNYTVGHVTTLTIPPDRLDSATITAVTNQTTFTAALNNFGDPDATNAPVGMIALLHDSSDGMLSVRAIAGYNNLTGQIVLNAAPDFEVQVGDVIEIYLTHPKTAALPTGFPTNFAAQSIDSSGRVLLQPTQAGVTIPTVTTVGSVSGDVVGKVLGGGSSTITGTGAQVVDAYGNNLATADNQTTLMNRLGAWTGSDQNTVLGAFQALFRSDVGASVPTDVNANLGFGAGNADNATDSLQAQRENFDSVLDGAPTFSDAMDTQGYNMGRAAKLDNLDMKVGDVRATIPGLLASSTIDTLTDQTHFTLANGPAEDNALNGALVVVTGHGAGTHKAVGIVKDYVGGSTRAVTLTMDPGLFTMSADDTVDVIAVGPPMPLWLAP